MARIFHRIYARLHGLPWKMCPICKRAFGGHEAASVLLWIAPGNSETVCRACGPRAWSSNRDRLQPDAYEADIGWGA